MRCCKDPIRFPAGVTVTWSPAEQQHIIYWRRRDGSRKKARRKTHKDAEKVALDVSTQLLTNPMVSTLTTPSQVSLRDTALAFIDAQRGRRVWAASYVRRQRNLCAHLNDTTKLSGWTAPVTEEILARVGGTSQQRQMLSLLRQTHVWAVRQGLMDEMTNPIIGVKVYAKRNGNHRVASPPTDAVAAFAREFGKERQNGELAVWTAACTGVRISELLALEHGDAGAETLAVDRQVDRDAVAEGGTVYGEDGQPTHWQTPHGYCKLPKGEKKRATLLPEFIADELRTGTGPIWLTGNSRYLTDSNWNRSIHRAAERAGWPKRGDGKFVWTWHSLRHHAALWMLEDLRMLPHEVAAVLGHTDATVTIRMYVRPGAATPVRASEATKGWRPPQP